MFILDIEDDLMNIDRILNSTGIFNYTPTNVFIHNKRFPIDDGKLLREIFSGKVNIMYSEGIPYLSNIGFKLLSLAIENWIYNNCDFKNLLIKDELNLSSEPLISDFSRSKYLLEVINEYLNCVPSAILSLHADSIIFNNIELCKDFDITSLTNYLNNKDKEMRQSNRYEILMLVYKSIDSLFNKFIVPIMENHTNCLFELEAESNMIVLINKGDIRAIRYNLAVEALEEQKTLIKEKTTSLEEYNDGKYE